MKKKTKKRKYKPVLFDEYLEECLKDPKFKKEYDALEGEYQMIKAIIEARAETNITQKELSKRTGISQSNLSRIETGVESPTVDTLNKIAMGFGKKLKISFE